MRQPKNIPKSPLSRPLPALRGRFPFRLGTTSYIIPADMETNIAALAGTVDDVELLFFESTPVSNLPTKEAIESMRATALETGLSYSVHLPLDAPLGAVNPRERKWAADNCCRVIDLTRSLDPFALILHLDGIRPGPRAMDDVSSWIERLSDSLDCVLSTGIAPSLICVENLDYRFALVAPLVEAFGLSICLDIGHLLLGGYCLKNLLERYLQRARVVHLHGVENGVDHRPVSCLPKETLRRIVGQLSREYEPERVVTLEVFNEADLRASLDAMAELIS